MNVSPDDTEIPVEDGVTLRPRARGEWWLDVDGVTVGSVMLPSVPWHPDRLVTETSRKILEGRLSQREQAVRDHVHPMIEAVRA